MTKATLKNLLAHKGRLALTALSIVLGVAFVTGTFVYSDTARDAFDRIFADAYDGIDVVVDGDSPLRGGEGVFFDEHLAADLAAVPGVRASFPTLQTRGVQIIVDGDALIENGDAQLGAYLPDDPAVHLGVTLRDGRPPHGDGEIVIDATSARTAGVSVGDRVNIVTPTSTSQAFTIVGIAGFGDDDDLGGASLALFDLPTAQSLFGRPGQIDGALILAEPDTDIDALIDSITAELPDQAIAQTGAEAADAEAAELHDSLAFVYTFLLVFAFIALFVGTFIIYNTFRIVIAQRSRELALLRALGATRLQVLRSVLIEAVAVGLASSGVGVIAGIGIAAGLRRIMARIGVDLPADRIVIAPRTVLIALVAGTAVSVASALLPAMRASRVAPLAAMRHDAASGSRRRLRARLAIGAVIALGGGLAVAGGLGADDVSPNQRLALVGPGATAIFIAAQVLAAPASGAATRMVGAVFARTFGLAGQLAQRNAGRSPRRTSATAAAIMIATALIASTNVMASSFRAAVDEVLDQGIDADFVATPGDPFALTGFSTEVADLVLELPEFDSATRLQFAAARVDASEDLIGGIDDHFADFLTLEDLDGDLDLAPDEMLAINIPNSDDYKLGDTVTVDFEQGHSATFTIAATAHGKALTGTFISRQAFDTHIGAGSDRQVFFRLTPGVSIDDAHAALDRIDHRFPTVTVQTTEELQADAETQITQLLGLVTALLGLTVIIALIGVANTMTLAVHERTREIGLLRAIGLSRRDTRRMIRTEASIITLFGAMVGVGLGVFFAWAILTALHDLGFTAFVIPIPILTASVAAAGLLAVAFASWPARNAARLDILGAINNR